MGLLDLVATPSQQVAYLFPEFSTIDDVTSSTNQAGGTSANFGNLNNVFIFQFWPSQVSDSYTPNYATKNIPGGSHPLYQWVSGNGREISFTANFVSELREDVYNPTITTNFQERVASAAANSTRQLRSALTPGLLPSSRYKINVSAAIAALQQYLYPTYEAGTGEVAGETRPPKKLVLVLPGTNIGRSSGNHGILCILKAAPITMESFFPSGELRSATLALSFAEVVQISTSGGGSQIKYIGAESYKDLAEKYVANSVNVSNLQV